MQINYFIEKIFSRSSWYLQTILLFFVYGLSIPCAAQCNVPTNLQLTSRTLEGGIVSWDAPTNPANAINYYYRVSGVPIAPTIGQTTNSTNLIISGFQSSAQVYVYVASRCSGGTVSAWTSFSFLTLSPNEGCPSAPYGINPAEVFNPTFSPTPDVIASDSYAGQYSRVNILRNRQYVFNSSVSTDYITITNDFSGVLAHGPAPLTWNSATILPNNSIIRYFTTTNSSCGTQQTERVKTIKGQLVPGCAPPTNLNAVSIQNDSAILTWPFQTGGMDYYVSTSSTTPNINQTPTGFTDLGVKELTGLSPNTTYYYWLRRVCNGTTFLVSEWVSGGSFITQASPYIGCSNLNPGQDLGTTFIPACFGNQEIISTSFDAGEFNVVRIQKNKIYTFYSSVETDFISIWSVDGGIIASGTTPLVWSSGDNNGDCKFYIHTSKNCGIEFIDRTQSIKCVDANLSCDAPNAFTIVSITGTTANVSWVGANHLPSNGYQYYVSNSSTAPTSNTPATGSSMTPNLTLTNLTPNSTYYMWVRSNCGSSTSSWVFGNNFSTVGASSSGCTSSQNGVLPSTTFTPGCFGNTETILTNASTRQYSNVTMTPNTRYTFSTDLNSQYTTGDYITITNADASQVYIVGTTPLVWDSGTNSGIMRYYIHSNFACGFDFLNRIKLISCTLTPNCNPPSTLVSSSITGSSATISWTPPNPAPSNGYQLYVSTTNTAPIATTAPSGSASGTSTLVNGLNPTTLYYVWVRSNCGSSTSSWSNSTSFTTTTSVPNGCTTAIYGVYPDTTFSPNCTGTAEIIVTDAYTSEYSSVIITSNTNYTFSSSVATDFITISSAFGDTVYTSGPTPLVWNSGTNTGSIRYYMHSDSNCAGEDIERIKSISCTSSQSCSPPSNLTVSNVLTVNAQLNWNAASPVPASGYDVYFSTINSITPATPPIGTVPDMVGLLGGLTPGTTYYFWVRSNCGASDVSNWVAGTSFTTALPSGSAGCVTATYGLYPESTFIPACSGINETIVTDAYAGEYANVNIVANKQYTFTSSVVSDFITISNANATVIFASGATPFVWNSGSNTGVVRYYFHTNSACGEADTARIKSITCQDVSTPCNAPINLTVSNVFTTNAQFNWIAASPSPASGYDLHLSVSSTISPTAVPFATVTDLFAINGGLLPGITYYFWVRSNCGNGVVGNWIAGPSFTTLTPTGTGCITAEYGLYPTVTFTPNCTGINETIVSDAYASEYSNVNIIANKQYTFSSSVTTDYITISNANATVIYASGVSPLVWNSAANTGVIRYYFHTNSSCGSQITNRIKTISCQNASICNAPSNLSVTNLLTTTAQINWNAASSVPASGYQIYYSTTNSVQSSTIPSNSTTGLFLSINSLTPATTYFYWVRSNCGASNVSSWVSGGSFITLPSTSIGCTNATYGLFPSQTITLNCTSLTQQILDDAYAGEYTNVSVLNNIDYVFSSSVATDFITLTNADASLIYASGTSPLNWNSGTISGVIRYYFHTNDACGEEDSFRIKYISCDTTLNVLENEVDTIKIYPNPTKDIINIVSDEAFDKFIIINNLGQKIVESTSNLRHTQINIGNYASGIYFIKVFKGTKNKTFKIVKE
jgi:hypothetical protein